MQRQIRTISGLVGLAVLLLAIFAGVPQVQSQQSAPVRAKASTAATVPAASSDANSTATQDQLIKLLRLSPTLTTVVARDPSLLADKDYVGRNNPELAKFLVAHPEVVRNPDFYLFSHLPGSRGHQDLALMRSVWPDLVSAPQQIFVPGSQQAPATGTGFCDAGNDWSIFRLPGLSHLVGIHSLARSTCFWRTGDGTAYSGYRPRCIAS